MVESLPMHGLVYFSVFLILNSSRTSGKSGNFSSEPSQPYKKNPLYVLKPGVYGE